MAIVRTSIAGNLATAGTTIAITVPAGGVPAGSLIVVTVLENNATGTIGTIADTAGNTYTKITDLSPNAANANGRAGMFYVKNCLALVSTNTITYTKITSGVSVAISAFYATGIDTVNPLDTAVTQTSTASSSSPTATSGTPIISGELFVGNAYWKGNAAFTQDSGHNWSGQPDATIGPTHGIDGGSQVNANLSTIIFNPTLSVSLVNCIIIAGFKPTPFANPPFIRPIRFFTRKF